MTARYAEVAVHLPVYGLYHYAIPERLSGRDLVGRRVVVRFGNRGASGVVVRLASQPPRDVERVRELDALLGDDVVISPELLTLSMWIAEYYEAPPGEVLRLALPAGSMVAATRRVELTPAGERAIAGEGGALSRRQRELLGAIRGAGGAMDQTKLLRTSSKLKVADVASLVEQGLAQYALQQSKQRVQARKQRVAAIARDITDDDRAALSRAKKRLAVLDALIAAGGEAPVSELTADHPRAADHLRALKNTGLVTIDRRDVTKTTGLTSSPDMAAAVTPPELNEAQKKALAAIREGIATGDYRSYLLHGITGSGKTEVYLHAIADVLETGRTGIVLVPEISLTPQLAARFRARFGDRVAVLHSGLSDRDRFDEWQRLRTGNASIALGARSAIYAPIANVGVVIVDEEHDSSFKQEEGVRYNARDVALVRAKRAGAVCVLGSATPALESYYAATQERHQLLVLPNRATPRPLPHVQVVDLRVYQADGDAMLTAPLADAIDEALAAKDQIILFLNRRGFATFVVCKACGHAFRCQHCSVSLTYHKTRDRLLCHYCGYEERVPNICPGCGADSIERKGLGTEKISDAIADRFPDARVARLDRDVASGAKVEAVLSRVARREVDILVGTQMVTKGHDFPGVTLVGVLCADTGLSLPDFRASERTFQLLMQVAGRAGRGDRVGKVLIQSYRGDAMAVVAAAEHNYEQFYTSELENRQELGYPPTGHLIAIRLDGTNSADVAGLARKLAKRAQSAAAGLTTDSGISVLGPAEAPLARIRGRTRWHLWLRGPDRRVLRHVLRLVVDLGELHPAGGGVRVTVDVDPVSAL